jgi:predicted nucleic acid-binding protein
MIFIDTSVLVCASTPSDPRHDACVGLLQIAEARGATCSSHSLAELFSMMSGRPRPLRLAPAEAARIVAHTSKRFHFVSLTAAEYVAAIDGVAELGHSGGIIYDALIVACARKAKASRIYTLNARHFRLVAPDLASRIVEP